MTLPHGVSELEYELYKAVAKYCNIREKKFLMQLKLQFLKRLSCYIEGRAHKPANV